MIGADSTDRCPFCGTTVRFVAPADGRLLDHSLPGLGLQYPLHDQRYWLTFAACPNCEEIAIVLSQYDRDQLIWPRGAQRGPIPEGVPPSIRRDFEEAALVLQDSPKASAALSRRCLQHVLLDRGGVKEGDNLVKQIEFVLPSLPSYLARSLDQVRATGNFAAHPIKSANTGEILEVEPGEAEWNLDVLEMLFDFYYEQPRQAAEKLEALNKKLADAGKRPLRAPDAGEGEP
jgi:hypothetical protein